MKSLLWLHNKLVKVWLGLDTEATWLGFRNDDGLG